MTSTTDAGRGAGAGALTYGTILRLFLPLSLSDVIMVVAGPILTIGLTKLAHPEVSLAAYSVAQNVAILLESPIIMLLHASNLLSRYRETYPPLRHFMLWANALLTVLYALLAFTPAYDVIFRTLLSQPDPIADAARPAFQAMLLWPAAIGWRRFYQGILIQHKRSGIVAYATFGRIGSLAAVTALGVLGRAPGASVAGVALVVSVIVEAAAVTWLARPVLKSGVTDPNAEVPGWAPRTIAQIALWYWPLAMTQILVNVVRPLINGGIARSADPELGLAAWPVAWSTILLGGNAVRMVQQVALTLLHDRRSYLMLRRFTLTAGVAASALMALVAVTPLGPAYMEWVLGLTDAALPAVGIGAVFPLYVALQNWLQALLMKDGHTLVVNAGAIVGGTVTLAAVYAGALIWRLPGAVLGIVSLLCGAAVELLLLAWASRPQRRFWLLR